MLDPTWGVKKGGAAPRAPATQRLMGDTIQQLRQEIEDLRSLIETVAGRRRDDPVLVESCEEAIRDRLARLEALEREDAPSARVD